MLAARQCTLSIKTIWTNTEEKIPQMSELPGSENRAGHNLMVYEQLYASVFL